MSTARATERARDVKTREERFAMRHAIVLFACLLGTACAVESEPPRAAVAFDSPPPRGDILSQAEEPTAPSVPSAGDASRVLVLQTTQLERTAEVIGPVDVHEPMGSDQAALRRLKEKAAAIGADAVVGVEFHHGEAEGEPTHLSGLAVRFVAPVTGPIH